jgi:hypothetical protein
MEMQQVMERMLAKLDLFQEGMKTGQAKIMADRSAD